MYLFIRRQATSAYPAGLSCAHCIRCRYYSSRMACNGGLARQFGQEAILMDSLKPDIHPLEGKVAIITGAGRGIGASIARELSNLGATAVVCGRTRAALESTAKSIAQTGGKAQAIVCDVTSLQSGAGG